MTSIITSSSWYQGIKTANFLFFLIGFALSHDSQRLDLTYLQNRLRVEVASLPDVTSSKEAAPTASPPSDAPTAFVADRQPRGGGNWGRAGEC